VATGAKNKMLNRLPPINGGEIKEKRYRLERGWRECWQKVQKKPELGQVGTENICNVFGLYIKEGKGKCLDEVGKSNARNQKALLGYGRGEGHQNAK